MPVAAKFNVENESYDIEPVITDEITEGSDETVTNKTVYEAIAASETIIEFAQNKLLSAVIEVGGSVKATVEEAIQALAAYHTDTPASGDVKPLTAGGAMADKSSVAAMGSTKNFTAGGAYAYFGNCATALAWMKMVFGNDYEQKVARSYFVD